MILSIIITMVIFTKLILFKIGNLTARRHSEDVVDDCACVVSVHFVPNCYVFVFYVGKCLWYLHVQLKISILRILSLLVCK